MGNIKEIFEKGNSEFNLKKIKSVQINWPVHATGVFNITKHFEPNFKLTASNKVLLKKLLEYFTGMDSCEYDLNKGLFIFGNTGAGKSLLFEKVFKKYTSEIICVNSFHTYTFRELSNNYKVHGDSALNELKEQKKGYRKASASPVYLDDFGAGEFMIKNFGNEINLIDTIIDIRYRIFNKFGKLTHATTNITPAEFEKLCDARTTSRMSEMFNIIKFIDKDFRKNKK